MQCSFYNFYCPAQRLIKIISIKRISVLIEGQDSELKNYHEIEETITLALNISDIENIYLRKEE